ncbi:hypothetical protein [Arenimonas oryziterrae]|uniref:Uncharacterized protein n=1 Tax=Arenimonas oryziterrae DSM 21050 = YC6267 TaxID=1121015 RepID=A0A091BEQ1_9GAMM|nr:hypothetical protein [Arenimonas oryziterrae]KFN42865.1 hypothetical protein N789_12095 [Arenimonas oryziterrae DSM 21050 = YC6267]
MRHHPVDTLESLLRRGKSLQQFIGGVSSSGETGVRWIELRPVFNGIQLWVFEAEDVGTADHTDIYSFPALFGKPASFAAATLATEAEAIRYAKTQFAASPNYWVDPGMAQPDYIDFMKAGRPIPWGR